MSDTPTGHWLGKPQAELIAELEASHRLRIAANRHQQPPRQPRSAFEISPIRVRLVLGDRSGPTLDPDRRAGWPARWREPDRLLGQNLPALAGQGGGGSPPSSAPSRFDDLEQRRAFRNLECLITGNDGRRRCMNLSGTPIFDGCGRFAGYRGSAVDITDRKDSELFINNIIETIPDPIFVKDQ